MFKQFSVALLATAVVAAPSEDLMNNLPDAPPFTTTTYSGYLDATETKKIHYVFS